MTVERVPIFDRVPICFGACSYESCKLCTSSTDCYGIEYDECQEYECLHVTKDHNKDRIISEILAAKERGSLLRLILDSEVSDDVLWAASYNGLNVCQININMLDYNGRERWLQHAVAVNDRCGAHTVLFMYPIIPTVVRVNKVIEIIDNFRSSIYLHINLGFCRLHGCKVVNNIVRYNTTPIPENYIFLSDDGVYECTDLFKQKFMNTVFEYTVHRKISVAGCGTSPSKNCHGIKRRKKNE